MYRLLCVLISLLILAAARGQMRTDDELREAAATFFADHTGQQNGMSASKTYRAENITLALQKENLAVATDGDRFVVLARNKEMMSVLGFSESSYSEPDMPLALTAWIETTNTLLSEEAPSHMFEQKSLKMPESVPDHVEPLIKTIWSQWDPYNAMVPHYIKSSDDDYTYPSDKGTYAEIPTGCIATSMSQLMNYYRYPAHGRGSHSLSVKQGNGTEEVLTMDFGKVTFDWSSMLDIYDYSYSFNPENNTFTLKPDFTQKQADAVATLMLACGIASDMNYTPKGSAAAMTIAASAFTQYFNYDAHYVGDATLLQNVMYKYLASSTPLIVSGPGHAFIIDGYDESGYLHANFGWEGVGDGYYLFPKMDKYEIEDFILARPTNKMPTPTQLTAGTLGSALSVIDNDKLFAVKVTGNLGVSDFFALRNKGKQTLIETIDLGDATNSSDIFTNDLLSDIVFFNLSLPRNIRSIDKGAFTNNAYLGSIKIPLSVTSIGEDAFKSCTTLSDLSIPSSVTSIGNNAFVSCRGLTCLTLPEGLKNLGFASFEHCINITSVTIPASLEKMDDYCFDGCRGITTVTYLAKNPRAIPSTAFYDYFGTDHHAIYDQATLRVPHGCKNKVKYLEGWKEFGNIVELPAADINNDTVVNTADVVGVYAFIEKGEASGFSRDTANVNGDGAVNTADIVAIYNYIVEGDK